MKRYAKIIARVAFYGALIAFAVIQVKQKKMVLQKKKSVKVATAFTEWKKHGYPVDVEYACKQSVVGLLKIGAKATSSKNLIAYVATKEAREIQEGQSFSLANYDKKRFGRVLSVGRSSLDNAGLHRIVMKLNYSIKGLNNKIVQTQIKTRHYRNIMKVSGEAIVRKKAGTYIWKIKNNKATLTPIRLSRLVGNSYIIAGGVSPGEIIAVRGKSLLKPQAKVEIRECLGCCNSGTGE